VNQHNIYIKLVDNSNMKVNPIRLILAFSIVLMLLPLANAAHDATVRELSPTQVWESVQSTFTFELKNTGTADDIINFTMVLPNFVVDSASYPNNGWSAEIDGSTITWTAESGYEIKKTFTSGIFTILSTASNIDSDTQSTWQIETGDNAGYTKSFTADPILIKNDDIAPTIIAISPESFTYVKNDKINFEITVFEDQTGLKSLGSLEFQDGVGTTPTGDVVDSIDLSCSNNNFCTGELIPTEYMAFPFNPFLDYRIILEDISGNIHNKRPELTYHLYVDYASPRVNLQSNPEVIQENNYEFIFNMSDDSFKTINSAFWMGNDPNIKCTLFIDGISKGINDSTPEHLLTTIQADLSGLDDGIHAWYVSCVDDAGWVGISETRNFARDLNAPVVELIAPDSGSYSADELNLSWKATDAFDTELDCYLTLDDIEAEGSVASANGEIITVFRDGFGDGEHTWSVICEDDTGHTGDSDEWTFIVDTTEPTVDLLSPIDEDELTSGEITFEFDAYDNLADSLTCELYVNDALIDSQIIAGTLEAEDIDGYTFQYNKTSFGEDFEWYISCTDEFNTGISDTYTFHLDTAIAGPTFTSNPAEPMETEESTLPITLIITFTEKVSIDSALLNGESIELETEDDMVFSYLSNLSSSEDYELNITAEDNYEHSIEASHTYTITYTGTSAPVPEIIPMAPSGGSGGGDIYGDLECNYLWHCDAWSTCAYGKRTRICKNYGTCEGEQGKPSEEQVCSMPVEESATPKPVKEEPVITAPSSETTTGTVGVGFASGLFGRIKERWYVIPVAAGLIGLLAWVGFGGKLIGGGKLIPKSEITKQIRKYGIRKDN